jgi:hypothetical protein
VLALLLSGAVTASVASASQSARRSAHPAAVHIGNFGGCWVSPRQDPQSVVVRRNGTGQANYFDVKASHHAHIDFRRFHATGPGRAVATVTVAAFVRGPGESPGDHLIFKLLPKRSYGRAFQITYSARRGIYSLIYRYRSRAPRNAARCHP